MITELYILKEDIENKAVDIEYAIEGLARILPKLDQAYKSMQWQPIENAPKDKLIRCWCGDSKEGREVNLFYSSTNGWWVCGDTGTVLAPMFEQPTYWMEKTQPPKEI